MKNSEKFEVVKTYFQEVEANLAQAYLESVGIDSIIQKDDCGGFYPQLQSMIGIKLLVHLEDLKKASEVFSELEK